MRNIKLITLELSNFKCHRHLRLDFNGRNAVIAGDNATGKSSVYDALMWLLFSKDSQGNGDKNFEVKPLGSDGNVLDHDALTSVEAVFDVNGEMLRLYRSYREKWETKRGSAEAVFTGNTSEYSIDGVPAKRNAFQDKVNELVDEDTFRLLTNTSHFAAGISWLDRRAVLFQVAGVMEDKQILATNEAFAPLVESMGKLSLEDYKKKLLSQKKGFVGAKTEIPARISECQKTIEATEGLDFAKAKAEVEALTIRKNSLIVELLQLDHNSAMDAKRLEIREAQLELTRLENENKAYRASQSAGTVNGTALKTDLANLEGRLNVRQKVADNEKAYIADLETRIGESRARWIIVNGETFTGGTCPTCGQLLPDNQLRSAMERFEANKKSRLYEIEKTANANKEAKAQAEHRLARQLEEIQQLEADIQAKKQEIAAAEANVVVVVDMEHYAENARSINARIDRISGELADMADNTTSVKRELNNQIEQVTQEIAKQTDIIGKETILSYSRKRIEELREDARNSAECLEAIEKMLYLMDEYSRYKTRFVEDSINGMFRIARFRLFREQANGGIEDRCDVVHEGVPYISVNNGMKINLGIDIINTLSTAYGVRVPLFVDNAESVTSLEQCGSQIIRLVVSENDKELRVNYEN